MPRPSTIHLRFAPHFRALQGALRLPAMLVVACWMLSPSARADALSDLQGLMQRGDLPAAMARADQALVAQPRDAQLRFLRGVVLMDLARDAEALGVFTQLTQEHPDLPDPYNNIGLLHARAGRPDAALSALQEALRCDPSHRTARANLGQVYLMLAVQAWDQLARTGPVELAVQRKLESTRALMLSGPLAATAPLAAR